MTNVIRYLRYDWPLFFVLRITNWFPENIFFIELRGFLASFFFKKCGRKLKIQRNVSFSNPSNISFGNFVTIPFGCWISAGGEIEFHDYSALGPYSVVVSGSFILNEDKPSEVTSGKIVFCQNAWIGAHCTILKDSVIGKNSIIIANSLVNRKIPASMIYGGVPVKKISEHSFQPKEK